MDSLRAADGPRREATRVDGLTDQTRGGRPRPPWPTGDGWSICARPASCRSRDARRRELLRHRPDSLIGRGSCCPEQSCSRRGSSVRSPDGRAMAAAIAGSSLLACLAGSRTRSGLIRLSASPVGRGSRLPTLRSEQLARRVVGDANRPTGRTPARCARIMRRCNHSGSSIRTTRYCTGVGNASYP